MELSHPHRLAFEVSPRRCALCASAPLRLVSSARSLSHIPLTIVSAAEKCALTQSRLITDAQFKGALIYGVDSVAVMDQDEVRRWLAKRFAHGYNDAPQRVILQSAWVRVWTYPRYVEDPWFLVVMDSFRTCSLSHVWISDHGYGERDGWSFVCRA